MSDEVKRHKLIVRPAYISIPLCFFHNRSLS